MVLVQGNELSMAALLRIDVLTLSVRTSNCEVQLNISMPAALQSRSEQVSVAMVAANLCDQHSDPDAAFETPSRSSQTTCACDVGGVLSYRCADTFARPHWLENRPAQERLGLTRTRAERSPCGEANCDSSRYHSALTAYNRG